MHLSHVLKEIYNGRNQTSFKISQVFGLLTSFFFNFFHLGTFHAVSNENDLYTFLGCVLKREATNQAFQNKQKLQTFSLQCDIFWTQIIVMIIVVLCCGNIHFGLNLKLNDCKCLGSMMLCHLLQKEYAIFKKHGVQEYLKKSP